MFQPFAANRSAFDPSPAGGGSVIRSITPLTITIAAASLTGTFTSLPSVVTANTILIWNGVVSTTASATVDNRSSVTVALTNTTTVTATRQNSTDQVIVSLTAVEFASGVNSIQAGTIVVTSTNTSNTATISAVGANAFVLYQGVSCPNSVGAPQNWAGVTLTNSTTVTANVTSLAGASQTVAYMVVDLDSSIVSGVQQKAVSLTSANVSDTDTITSVTTTNTLLMYGGISVTTTAGYGAFSYETVLTNGTTITKTRVGTSVTQRTVYYTAVSFNASALSGNIQRGTITLAAATSNTATISSVTTSKSFVNWGNFTAANSNTNVSSPSLTLTNATTVTAAVNSAGSPTVAYEVIQFS